MLQLHPEATIPTQPSSNGPSNPASEEPPRRGGTPPPLGGTRSEAGCRCPKAGKARPSRALASPRPLDPVASPRAPSGPRLPGSRLSCQSDADFPHGQQTNQRAGVLFDPSARRLFGPSARRLFGPSARRSSAFRRALKRGSRWFSSNFFFFRHFRVLRHSANPRVPEAWGPQVRLGKAKLPRDVSETVTWSGAFRRLLRSVSPERVGVWTCGLAYNWEGVEFHDLVIVALCLCPCLIWLPVFLEEAKSDFGKGSGANLKA